MGEGRHRHVSSFLAPWSAPFPWTPLGSPLDRYPLSLVHADLVARAVVELGRPGRLVGGDHLCLLDCSTVFQVGSNAGRANRVAADGRRQACIPGTPLD